MPGHLTRVATATGTLQDNGSGTRLMVAQVPAGTVQAGDFVSTVSMGTAAEIELHLPPRVVQLDGTSEDAYIPGAIPPVPFVSTYSGFLDTPGDGSYATGLIAPYKTAFDFLNQGTLLTIWRGVASAERGGLVTYAFAETGTTVEAAAPGNACDAAVLVLASRNGTVSGRFGPDQRNQYTLRATHSLGRTTAQVYTWVNPDPAAGRVLPPAGLFAYSGSPVAWYRGGQALILDPALLGPVTRQYPRDSRGLAAAARIHPAPRGARLVGGHQ